MWMCMCWSDIRAGTVLMRNCRHVSAESIYSCATLSRALSAERTAQGGLVLAQTLVVVLGLLQHSARQLDNMQRPICCVAARGLHRSSGYKCIYAFKQHKQHSTAWVVCGSRHTHRTLQSRLVGIQHVCYDRFDRFISYCSS